MNKRILFIIFLALLLLPPGLSAQSGKGKNGGTVLDKSSNPIIGATVQNKDNGSWAITDEKGEFVLDDLSKGATLIIACIGYGDRTVVYEGDFPLRWKRRPWNSMKPWPSVTAAPGRKTLPVP